MKINCVFLLLRSNKKSLKVFTKKTLMIFLLSFLIIFSGFVFAVGEEKINCSFMKTTDCVGTYIPIVSFANETGTSIMPFNRSKYPYALCCNASDIVPNYNDTNKGIVARIDYWLNPICDELHLQHCNYPYNPNIYNWSACDRGLVNISLMFKQSGNISYTIAGTLNNFYRPYTMCIPPRHGKKLISYVNMSVPGINCSSDYTKLFVLAKEENSLIYKDNATDGKGHAVCVSLINDTSGPEIHIISPKPITYIEPNIDIKVFTGKQAEKCNYSLDGGADEGYLLNSTMALNLWKSAINVSGLGTHNLIIQCTDLTGNYVSQSQVEFKRELGTLGNFNSTPITLELSQEKVVPIFLNNQYSYAIVYNLQMTHSTGTNDIPLTNFGWFDGHRSDLNRTNLYVTLAPGQSQTVAFIQYGGLFGEGNLILNVKANEEIIIKDSQKPVEIKSSTKETLFAPTPDIQTSGFIVVLLSSMLVLFAKKPYTKKRK